jgi:molybdate transport system regulatory protein
MTKGKRKPAATKVARRKALAEQGPLSRASLRLRIVFPAERQLGPGKADLLEAIGRTGSISSAARDLGMSYRRAWLLVDEIGKLFKRPILTTAAGGAHGGGAELTDFGRALVAAYRRIEDRAAEVARSELVAFESDLNEV